MSLYENKDNQIFSEKIPDVIKKLQEIEKKIFSPDPQQTKLIWDIIFKYVKENKRKIYGGYALHLLIKKKNPEDAIYDSDIPNDADVYTPDPINDLMNVCNLLLDKGIKHILGKDALHEETYKLTIDGKEYCDFTYVPTKIYSRIPFSEINELYIVGSEFLIIDYYRIFTDVILSYVRWEKVFKRFQLLQKYYPLHISKNKITYPTKQIAPLFDKFFKTYLNNNKNFMLIGNYVYNVYVKMSNINKIKPIAVPFYEMIVINYVPDCTELFDALKKIVEDEKKLTKIEYYPFFQFYGHNVDFLYDGTVIARIYNYNYVCRPFVKVDNINIGSFQTVLMMEHAKAMKFRSDKNNEEMNLCYAKILDMTEIRKYYFDKTGKDFLSDTIFKDFSITCMGEPISPQKEKQHRIEAKKKQKKPLVFKYDPETDKNRGESIYQFRNSAGTEITNIKNLKIKV